MATLTISRLYKRFGSVEVLKGIDLEARTGEFVALVGPSGCGKSTLLAMIAGLESVSEGEIRIDGRIVNSVAPKDRDIAMVFQSYALYPTMTARQNMTFGMESRGVPKAEQDAAIKRVASLLQIEPLLNRKPGQLSGGQRQRVAMGRALVRDPKLFLFDEPLSNLDAKLRVDMRTEIKKLHLRVGKTTIYVTHDQIEAMTLASRIAVMHQGAIQQFDEPQVVYDRPANMFVAGFMGSPSMNFIAGELVKLDGRPAVAVALGGGETATLAACPNAGVSAGGRQGGARRAARAPVSLRSELEGAKIRACDADGAGRGRRADRRRDPCGAEDRRARDCRPLRPGRRPPPRRTAAARDRHGACLPVRSEHPGAHSAGRRLTFATYPSLAGRTVFISGGATGIGADIVRAFARNHARVAFVDCQARGGRGAGGGAEGGWRDRAVSPLRRHRCLSAASVDRGSAGETGPHLGAGQ